MNLLTSSSLKFKALLLGIVPAFVLSLLLGTYLVEARLDDLQQAHNLRGQALTDQLAANCVYGLFSGNTASLEGVADYFFNQPDIVSVSIRDAAGNVLVQRSATADERANHDAKGLRRHDFQAVVASLQGAAQHTLQDLAESVSYERSSLGSVELALLDMSSKESQRRVILTAILMTSLGMLITALISLLMSRRMIRSIRQLAQAVSQIKKGNLSVRIEQRSQGEIGILEEGFNSMAAGLAMTQEELLLEVDRTTHDLQVTMDALEMRNIELSLARKKAELASAEKSDFLATMSHEIRTPMNGIIGFADLLSKTKLEPMQQKQLQAIRESAGNLLRIVNDILDFSKLELGRLTFNYEPVDLALIVNSIKTHFQPQIDQKGLEMRVLLYDDVPLNILGDDLRIRQVLLNIIGNAIKFTAAGKVIVRIMLDQEGQQEVVRFSVEDTGIGFPEQRLNELFDAFTQASTSTDRVYGGTGLGLSISKKLVEGMNGWIGASSCEGKGSTFWFSLPLDLPEEDQAPAKPRSISKPDFNPDRPSTVVISSVDTSDFAGLNILVVDDNAINLELASMIMTAHQIHVVKAMTSEDVLNLAVSKPFDLILMDIHLPEMNGIEVSRRIRVGDGPNAHTPIVAVTADVVAKNDQQVSAAGIDEVMLKPYQESQLLDIIRHYCLGESIPNRELSHDFAPLDTSLDVPLDGLPSSEASRLPARDIHSALVMMGGNRDIVDRLFERLTASMDQEIATITQLLADQAWEPLWESVHSFQGATSICGVPAFYSVLRRMESAVKQRDLEHSQALLRSLKQEAERLRDNPKSAEGLSLT